MPPLMSDSSESSNFNAPPAGYIGILSVLRHFQVDVSHLSRNALRHLRDLLVHTPPTMEPTFEDEATMATLMLLHHGEAARPTSIVDPGSNSTVAATAADSSGDLRQRQRSIYRHCQ